MGKITVSETREKQRHNPLHRDITTTGGNLREVPRRSNQKVSASNEDDGFLDAATSRKILQLAKEQQEELENEEESESVKERGFAQTLREQIGQEEDEEEEDEDFEH